MPIVHHDLPPLYCDFDESSSSAQRAYLRVIVADLAVLVLAAAVSSFASKDTTVQRWLYGAGAVLLTGGMLLTLTLSKYAFEKTWYGGRAAAETVKSLAWKYMSGAAPFEHDSTSAVADAAFVDALWSILRDRKDLALSRASVSRAGEPITRKMREVRALNFQERLDVYLAERVRDQVRWYSTTARYNERMHSVWLIGVLAVQAVATVAAVVQVAKPEIAYNGASALAALSTALLAWSQLKRHRELAQSYGIAAHELGLAAARAIHLNSAAELSQFVNDTETAISREHTMWVARREAVS